MEIYQIAKKIEEAGGKIYLVGGAVRDQLLGNKRKDEDYCITGIVEEQFVKIFPIAKKIGKTFPVYMLEGKEIAFARIEKKIGKKHQDFEVEAQKEISIEEDLKRRDITINAMAIDVLENKLIDPFGGREDLKNKTIKKISHSFREDPLRAYRVARFAACLEMEVEEETLQEMKKMKEELKELSVERVWIEMKKALACKNPSCFFETLKKVGILEVHFPEIQNLIGKMQPKEYHPEGDSYVHTMQVVDICSKMTQKDLEEARNEREKESILQIRFASLVHDLGKGETPKEILPHHYGHEKRGEKLVEQLGKRLKIPNAWIECGKIATKEHGRGGLFNKMTPAKQVDFITRVEKSKLGLEGLEIVVKCDKYKGGSLEELKNKQLFARIGKECIRNVTGKEIVKKNKELKGKKVGEQIRKERIEWIKRLT